MTGTAVCQPLSAWWNTPSKSSDQRASTRSFVYESRQIYPHCVAAFWRRQPLRWITAEGVPVAPRLPSRLELTRSTLWSGYGPSQAIIPIFVLEVCAHFQWKSNHLCVFSFSLKFPWMGGISLNEHACYVTACGLRAKLSGGFLYRSVE